MEYLLDTIVKQAEEIAFNNLQQQPSDKRYPMGFYPIPEIECYVEAELEVDGVVYYWYFIDVTNNDSHHTVGRKFVKDRLERFNNGALY